LEVAGGTYYRTYTNLGSGPTGEADPATVSSFRLDKYLVTVGRFRQFVNAWQGGWLPAPGSGKHAYLNGGLGLVNDDDDAGLETEPGWVATDDGNIAPTNANLACSPDSGNTWTNTAGSHESLPISCVLWQEAYAFCIWDGGFLPSEAEWEYAAAGGNQQREYPWGSTDPGTASQYAIYGGGASSFDCYYPSGTLAPCTGVTNIAPVGTATLGAGLWGQLDLAGEANEWTLDWYVKYVTPCTDCSSLTAGFQRVIRGGAFNDHPSVILPTTRFEVGDSSIWRGAYVIGVRCARAP
jgi:formylglycine-generating enzyme required for sulfatase activity